MSAAGGAFVVVLFHVSIFKTVFENSPCSLREAGGLYNSQPKFHHFCFPEAHFFLASRLVTRTWPIEQIAALLSCQLANVSSNLRPRQVHLVKIAHLPEN